MKKTSASLRSMQLSDIENAMNLSNAEGWNQTEKDWKLLIENPQNTCLIAKIDNKAIGTTTAINYSNEVAWIGMVLVDKEYRGLGISKLLLENILKKLESCKSIKLDATPAGQQVYKKFGFKDEYIITRMTNSSRKSLLINEIENIIPEPIQSKNINEITALDEFVFGANRMQLIEYLIKEYPHKAWLLKHENKITGFVLGRDGNIYHHVGPVIASTITDAKILISKALRELNNQRVVMDVLNDKQELLNWLHSTGFTRQREFVRMYKKENLFPGMIDKLHLICGPEFG